MKRLLIAAKVKAGFLVLCTLIVLAPLVDAQSAQIIGSWVAGTSHIEEPGTNRALIFTAHAESSTADVDLVTVTYGGQSMTKVVDWVYTTSYSEYVAAFILNEAGIAAATDSNFVVTWGAASSEIPAYSSVFLSGVNQSLVGDTGTGGSATTTAETPALSTNNGDMVIVAACNGNAGTYSTINGFTAAIELTMTSSDGIAGYLAATGAAVTPGVSHTNVNRQAVIGLVVKDEGCVVDGDCDDSNVCTDDACVGLVCQYTYNTDVCDDGAYCNGTDTCSAGNCSVHAGNPCPETECNTCQEATDTCFDTAGTSCTDDGNICTDDQCDGAGVCAHPNNTDPCDDGIYCNGSDTCGGGSCSAHAGDPCPDDGLYCTGTESCDEVGDQCLASGDPCPGTECNTCQESTDTCLDTPGTLCTDDGNICTDDQCDGAGVCGHPNNTDPCDDLIACTESDTCSGGACNGTPNNTLCSDGNSCTNDICTVGVGCSNPNNTDPCDDGIYCNGSDTCGGGSCSAHAGDPCPGTECNTCQEATDSCFDTAGTSCTDEGNICTDDQCDGAGVCAHPNNTDPCDDGIYCNGSDTCGGGSCSVHTGDPCPDDGLYCTGTESCDEIGDQCLASGDPCPGTECNTCQEATDSCFDTAGTLCTDEGNICTDDQCDGAGVCAHPNNTDPCDDGTYCNGNDTCSGGTCTHTGDPCSDDNFYCTGTEYCDETLDTCGSTGDPCTPLVCDDGTDTCTGSTASLILLDAYGTPGTIRVALDNLEDEVSEVRFDLCDPEQHPWLTIPTGACTMTGRVPQGPGASCQITDPVPADGCLSLEILAETGNFISLGTGPIAEVGYTLLPVPPVGEFADLVHENIDVLDDLAASVDVTPQAGKVGASCQNDGDCEDNNPCTTDTCNGGVCEYSNVTGVCDDGLYCTDSDTCVSGVCTGTARDCDDGLYCTGAEICDEVGDQCLASGDPCPGTECNTCQESTDTCLDTPGTLCTDDGNICTDDQCDGAGVCGHSNNTDPCDDLIACTESDTCSGGACNGTPNNTLCSDGNSCTNDICTVGVGCSNPNNTDPCDDGIYCNGSDTCGGGSCSAHAGDPCPGTECNTCQEATDSCFDTAGTSCTDEGNVCTDDQCNGAGVCGHPNNTDPCNDFIACTESDTCSAGACNGTPNNTLCSDGNICTDDICTVGVGCSNPNNTDPCDDGIYCNGTDTCGIGSCSVHTGDPCPDDGLYCTGTESCDEIGDQCLASGDPCPGTECNTCQEATDSCFDTAGTACTDDGTVCTDDQCDGAGVCGHTNNTDPCDDGLFCTQTDECQSGQCVGSDDPCLDDGDFCNGVEHCQEDVGSFLCDSTGDPCDLLLTCDEAGDVCDVSDVSLIIADAFGYSGTIDIELENSLDSLGAVHVDVCDKDQRVWHHIDTGSCGTSARSSEFSCAISDLGGGCVRVDLTTVSGVIDPGTGVIAQLTYTIDVTAHLGDFADLILENSDVRDDTATSLSVTPKPGMVGVVECTVDGNCDDSNVCTDDTCVGNICQYSNNTDPCDDGLFCNGNDTCNGGSCSVNSGDPCPLGTNCNEGTNSCDSTPVTSTTTSINSSTTTTISGCESDADCDDELFCNGDEICVEGECQHAGDPCPESTTCFEETEECRFTEVCAISIAPETTALVSEQFLNFTITTTGDCGDSDYEWSVQSEIGSAIDQNGNFVAGINTDCSQEVTDQIEVIDSTNDISGEVIVTVSCDRIKEVINISNPLWVFYPNDIYSSHWLPTPHVLLIFAEQGLFDPRSSLVFEPVGSVTTLFNLGRKNIMIALVLVEPNAQEGPYRASVTTGSHMVTKKEALRMHIMPWILDGESNY